MRRAGSGLLGRAMPWTCVKQPAVAPGDAIRRGQRLGQACRARAAVQLEEGGKALPLEAFLRDRRALPLPAQEPMLLLVDPAASQLRVYARGREVKRYEVGFGQAAGPKVERGDLKTPSGMYFTLEKSTGPYGAFYGGYWGRLSYPNAFDAQRGLAKGWLSAPQAKAIDALPQT